MPHKHPDRSEAPKKTRLIFIIATAWELWYGFMTGAAVATSDPRVTYMPHSAGGGNTGAWTVSVKDRKDKTSIAVWIIYNREGPERPR